MRTLCLPAAAAALCALAGCGSEEDDRPLDAEYLVPAIFRPSCGTAACHSTATAREGLVLDTVEGVCLASDPFEGRGPLTAFMKEDAEVRMPLDGPLPYADIALLDLWYYEEPGIPFEQYEGCP